MWDPYAGFETTVMPNGLTVHVAHWPDRPWSAVGFVVHSGARVDPIGLEGTAHFVEHLVSRNGNMLYGDVEKFFDRIGGSCMLGVTNFKSTSYSFFAPSDSDNLKKAFRYFGNMLLDLRLERFIEEQRKVILSEFHRKFPIPAQMDLRWRERKTVFYGTWLERFLSPLGEPGSISRISEMDLQNYYDWHYTPANMSVVCVGGLGSQEVLKYLENSPFSLMKTGKRSIIPEPQSDFHVPSENRYVVEMHKIAKTEVPMERASYSSVVVVPGTIDWPILTVFRNMVDRLLFDEIRERRGWTYSVGLNNYNHQAFREATISCSGIPLEALDRIEAVIESCLESIPDMSDLFSETVHRLVSDIHDLDMTGRALRDNVMNQLQTDHLFTTSTEDNHRISLVTLEDIREVMKWFAPHRRRTVLTVP